MLRFTSTFFRWKIFGDTVCNSYIQNSRFPVYCSSVLKLEVLFHFHRPESTSTTFDSRYSCPDNLQKTYFSENTLPSLQGNLLLDELGESDLMLIFRRFGMQGLNVNCLKKYSVKVSSDFATLLFPFYSLENSLPTVQKMVYNEDIKENITYSYEGLDNQSLFGWSQIGPNDKELVVTSDPLDALAVNQSTGVSAVSLPFVDPLTFKFSSKLLALLNTFNKVIFWMKPDLHKLKHHRLLRYSLKEKGYYIWSHEFRNPLFCLQSGSNIQRILKKSLTLYDERLKFYSDYKDLVDEELNSEKASGMKWKRFAALNDILKGHRRGEVTIFSGQTGIGKTTFMSEYSLDLCMQGIPTLWVNLEIPNPRLLKTMLCQFARCTFTAKDSHEQKKFWEEKFEKIDMCLLNFSDRYSLDGILSAMLKSISFCGTQHIIIDNLQFMMYMGDHNSNIDQLRRQDQIFTAFREFATFWNCHITIIIHPRKEPEFSELTMTSISGTAKATQEADNVLILQTTKSRQYLQVAKNRFDGCKGCVLLDFDEKTCTYAMKNMGVKVKNVTEVKSAC